MAAETTVWRPWLRATVIFCPILNESISTGSGINPRCPSLSGLGHENKHGLPAGDTRLLLPLLRLRGRRSGRFDAAAVPEQRPRAAAALYRKDRSQLPALRLRAGRRRRNRGRLPGRWMPLPGRKPEGQKTGRTREKAARRNRPGAGAAGNVQPVVGRGRPICGDRNRDG